MARHQGDSVLGAGQVHHCVDQFAHHGGGAAVVVSVGRVPGTEEVQVVGQPVPPQLVLGGGKERGAGRGGCAAFSPSHHYQSQSL